jgi:aminoglycoside phosphotransferase (APT) family kinase protein
MHAEEVDVDDHLVRSLIDSQCPQCAGFGLRRFPATGTDNAIYRLGPELGVRLPRIHWAVGQIAKEYDWLPRLAPQLPVPVPEPVAKGEPGSGYPFPWLVYRWVRGAADLRGAVDDWCRLAHDVAGFVGSLQLVDPTIGPPAGTRGGPLVACDDGARRAIAAIADEIDADRARAVWDSALAADPWDGGSVWVHGDLLPGNVLVAAGRLTGVIDWSPAGVGDPDPSDT